jgi:hypothetical protein
MTKLRADFNSRNACSHSVQGLLSSSLISEYVKIKIYRTVILLVVLYGCDTWSLKLTKQHKLRVFVSRVHMKTFGSKRDEVTGE